MKNIGPFKLYTKKPNDINYGEIYTMEVKLPILYSPKRIVRVYLPEDFDKNKRYPVLFMSDGQNIVDKYTSAFGAWDIDIHEHNLLNEGHRSFIVVGIDCPIDPSHRALEYSFPFIRMDDEEEGSELNKLDLDFESHLLFKYIATELLPLIKKHFPISDRKEDIGAGGSSMGGVFSFSLLSSYPDIFGYALIFSPGFFLYPENEVGKYLDSCVEKLSNHKMYFYSGNVGFESKFLKRTIDVYDYFKAHGFNENEIYLDVDLDGEHNEPTWSKHFEQAVKFCLPKQ